MAFMTLPDEEAIVLAWADSSKATGFVKKIPMKSNGDASISTSPGVLHVPPQSELPGDVKEPPKPPAEMAVI
jgi:hypothetical protein